MPVAVTEELPVETDAVRRYELVDWRRDFGLVAGVAVAHEGADFGLTTHRPTPETPRSWSALTRAVGGFRATVVSRQVHGAEIARYDVPFPRGLRIRDGFDGHVTGLRGLLLAVTVADCVPVFLADPGSGAICLVHAGWRGIASGILEAGIRALAGSDGVHTGDVVMHCGIAICGACYEVGPEVVQAVVGARPAGSQRLDLRQVLVERADGLGVGRVSVSPLCTVHGGQRFSSYRREGTRAGRMAAFLGRPPA